MPTRGTSTDKFIDSWLVNALRGEASTEEFSENQVRDILERGKFHGVLSLLQNKIKDIDRLPETLQLALQRHTRHVAGTELARVQELQTLFSQFTEAQIPFLLMKGEVLAHTLYSRSYLRERCDTDLLFPDKKASEEAWKILSRRGYERRTTLQGEFVGYQYSCFRQLPGGLYHALDIHHKINDYGFFARLFDFEELARHCQSIPELGPSANGPLPEWSMAFACIHHATNIPQGNANRLIWIYDVELLASSFNKDQWQQFTTLVTQKKIAGICLQTLEISIQIFDSHIPRAVLDNLRESAKSEQLQPEKMKTRRAMYQLDFLSNKGGRNKLQQLSEHLFPSAAYMKQKYGLQSSVKLPYYYIYRILRGFFRYS